MQKNKEVMGKKVLFIISFLRGGGAERVVSIWASQLAVNGFDVSILVNARSNEEYPVHEKVKIYSLANNEKEFFCLGKVKRLSVMRKWVKNIAPDVVIPFLERTQIWTMFATIGIKLYKVETVRNSPWRTEIGKILKIFWKKCFKRADKVILQTPEQGEYFSKKVQKKCVVIPNPLAKQYLGEINRDYSDRITKFIAAGRLNDQKNYPLMIKGFAEVAKENKEITLDIFGAGEKDYIAKLQSLIDSLEMTDRIILRGRTPNLIDEYKKAHAYLMTSDFEGMPNALAEAMATKLICISSNCKTGTKDLIDDNINGFLFNVGKKEEFSALIKKVVDMDKETAKEIGEKAREKVLKFLSKENSLRKLIDLIEEA